MMRPRLPPSRRADAIAALIAQFASLGWLRFDRTGLMLVSEQFDALLAELSQ
jgi:hypothetical protein